MAEPTLSHSAVMASMTAARRGATLLLTMGHDRGIDDGPRNRWRMVIVLALSSTYLVAEVVGGVLTGSLALLADAGHMLTDVAGVGLALFAMTLSERPATPERTYGYYRAEILAALANGVILVGISGYVLYEAYRRFRDPPEVASSSMLVVASVGLVVNVVGLLVLREGSQKSLNMKGAYFEVVSDALTSVAVIIAGLIMWTTGWYYADPLLSAAIGLFILPRTWMLLREAVGILLEGTPANLSLGTIREAINSLPGVTGVHDLHVWTITSGRNALSVHVVAVDGASSSAIVSDVQRTVLERFEISHATVQVEPAGHAETEVHL